MKLRDLSSRLSDTCFPVREYLLPSPQMLALPQCRLLVAGLGVAVTLNPVADLVQLTLCDCPVKVPGMLKVAQSAMPSLYFYFWNRDHFFSLKMQIVSAR
jgi:hypothetical protein